MNKLFNKTFFNFAFGFIAMLLLGLLGIVIARYVEWDHYVKTNSSDVSASTNQVDVVR
jgi:hypothetical protein